MRSDIALRKFLCLSSGFIEDNWILISAFVFNLLKYIFLIGVYEENSTSYKYIAGKGSFIFIISLGNGGFSPLVLHQNSQQLFQRLVSMWNLKSCLWNFHTLYSTVNFEWICESFINFFFCSNSMLCLSEDCQLTVTQIFQRLTHFIMQFEKKISLVNITADLLC